MKSSVLTIYSGRREHLAAQYSGLLRSNKYPAEWILIAINEDPVIFPEEKFPIVSRRINSAPGSSELPLAQARNEAFELSSFDNLIFLDVDCIPYASLVSVYERMTKDNELLMGTVGYLPPQATATDWSFADLEGVAEDHPAQPSLTLGERRMSHSYELFWSLCFGITKETFSRIGGFDETYTGYGGEDTDFAYSARDAGVRFGFVGARAFHQYHPTYSPPLQHLESIVENAKYFRSKWGEWPMKQWLNEFARRGIVHFCEETADIEILRRPDDTEIKAANHSMTR